jgi:SET domain-containing protein
MKNRKTVKKIIKDLEDNIYCRLRPSKIQGVGVFAIKKIPKGTKIFEGVRKIKFINISPKIIFQNKKINPAVKKMVKDFFVIFEKELYLPNCSLNKIDISFYVNHSENPNIAAKDGEIFFAIRNIKKGEEITANYKEYCDEY